MYDPLPDTDAVRRLTDEQYARLVPLIPPAKPGGRPRRADLRAVLDALFHQTRTGCRWRELKAPFPPWQTVYGYHRIFVEAGVWDQIAALLRAAAIESLGGRSREEASSDAG